MKTVKVIVHRFSLLDSEDPDLVAATYLASYVRPKYIWV